MTRNTLGDLNNHLFEQLERLNDEELSKDDLKTEISRSIAMSKIASQIIHTGNLVLKAQEFDAEYSGIAVSKNKMLEGNQ